MSDRKKTLQDLFAVAQLTQRLIHASIMRAFQETGIAPSQAHLLQTVEKLQPVSFKALATELRLSPGAVTQLVEGLVQSGLVKRMPSETDRRVSNIELTLTGIEKLTVLKEKKQAVLLGVVENLSDDELENYLHVQRKMLEYLESNNRNVKTK